MKAARGLIYIGILLLGALCVSSCATEEPPQPVKTTPLMPEGIVSRTPTPAQLSESPPKRININKEQVYSRENYDQILIIEGYLDPQGFVCDAKYCWTDLCPKPGCNVAYGGKQPVGGVGINIPRDFYESLPKTQEYKRGDIKYRTHDGKIVTYRDRVQIIGKFRRDEKGEYLLYVQKIMKT